MLILATVFLFILIPLVMFFLYLVRPRFKIQGFLAVLAVITGWILVYLARPDLPHPIPLLAWKPVSLFLLSPQLLIDSTSWYLALALVSLVAAVVITSISQAGQSSLPGLPPTQNQAKSVEEPAQPEAGNYTAPADTSILASLQFRGWIRWAFILLLTSLGLLAVMAGNLLTLLLAWSALDIMELVILLSQIIESEMRKRIILSFSARVAGICLVLATGVLLWMDGKPITFDAISLPVSTLLIVAAGLRLGVLPLHPPFSQSLPIDRHFGTVLRLVPAVSCSILLVRVSDQGAIETITPFLLGFTILAGVYGVINWLRAEDEIEGRLYWLLGTSSLIVISAILRSSTACLVWSAASLLSGGLIFSMSLRHKNLAFVSILGVISLSSLPFTPTWQSTVLYQIPNYLAPSSPFFITVVIFLFIIQALLLAGFMRHAWRGLYPANQTSSEHVERWVWFLYPFGLIFILATHWLIGLMLFPNLHNVPLSGWGIGPVVLVCSAIILYVSLQFPQIFHPALDQGFKTGWDRIFSLDWLYRFLWRIFQLLSRGFAVVSAVLEGEGGLLWALVIFGLIFVFLQR